MNEVVYHLDYDPNASYAGRFDPAVTYMLTGSEIAGRPSLGAWLSYGLGWFQQDFQGRMINFHTGSLSGLIAIVGLDRDNHKAVIVLGNRDHAEMRHAILWHVMDESEGDARRDWNQDIWVANADGSEPRQVTYLGDPVLTQAVTGSGTVARG